MIWPIMLVAGADGYAGGWVLVLAEAVETLAVRSVVAAPSFGEVLRLTDACNAVGIDIPIGLKADGRREADILARRLLGGVRASSVFPAPIRPILYCDTYREACEISAAVCGRKISRQTFAILPKIREADEAMTPAIQRRVNEVHPEVCFRELNGGVTLPDSKHTSAGLDAREDLLAAVYNERFSRRPLPRGATRDDLYDACAAAWTASRVARGEAFRLPPEPEIDGRGLRMEIVY